MSDYYKTTMHLGGHKVEKRQSLIGMKSWSFIHMCTAAGTSYLGHMGMAKRTKIIWLKLYHLIKTNVNQDPFKNDI